MFQRVANRLPAWGWALLLVVLPLLVRGVMASLHVPPLPGDVIGIAEPDPWLRLTLVKNWLSGASWYDHRYPSNAPDFATSPWTRPLDIVIAALVKLQPGDAPLAVKLLRVSLFLPSLWMACLTLGLLSTVCAITPAPAASLMVAVLLMTVPAAQNYFGIGNADHHAPLAALWAWVLYFMLASKQDGWRMPLGAGLILSLMLWISPEALMLMAICMAWLGLCWLCHVLSARPVARLASVMTVASAAAVMVEHPIAQWRVPQYDTISIVHVVLLGLCAMGSWSLTLCPQHRWVKALTAGAVLGSVLAVMHAAYPDFFGGPLVLADTYIHTHFLPRIMEAQPLWREHPVAILAMLLQPLIALGIAWLNSSRQDGVLPLLQAACLCVLLCATLGMFAAGMRWYYYVYPVVIITLAPWLAAWLTPTHATLAYFWPAYIVRGWSENDQLMRRLPLLMVVLALPLALMLLKPDTATPESKRIDACMADARKVIAGGELAALGQGESLTVYAPTDLGAEILFYTPHRIVASNYHREGAGIRDAWRGEKTKSDAALSSMFARRGVQALLLCPRPGQPERSVLRQLYEGKLQLPWLVAVPTTTPKLGKNKPVIFLVKDALADHTSPK